MSRLISHFIDILLIFPLAEYDACENEPCGVNEVCVNDESSDHYTCYCEYTILGVWDRIVAESLIPTTVTEI